MNGNTLLLNVPSHLSYSHSLPMAVSLSCLILVPRESQGFPIGGIDIHAFPIPIHVSKHHHHYHHHHYDIIAIIITTTIITIKTINTIIVIITIFTIMIVTNINTIIITITNINIILIITIYYIILYFWCCIWWYDVYEKKYIRRLLYKEI